MFNLFKKKKKRKISLHDRPMSYCTKSKNIKCIQRAGYASVFVDGKLVFETSCYDPLYLMRGKKYSVVKCGEKVDPKDLYMAIRPSCDMVITYDGEVI